MSTPNNASNREGIEHPPISWCRIFRVGPVCPKLCEDCAATYRRKREMERSDG